MSDDDRPESGTTDPEGSSREGEGPFGGWSGGEATRAGNEIACLAGQIAAATARFLELLGEFDARDGWRAYAGMRSASHWLSWRTGMDLRTAREHLRVARALRDLPVTRTAFRKGRLSYSKVRALCRVATVETEQGLVDMATHAPAAHVERLTRGLVAAARINGGDALEVLPGDHEPRGRSVVEPRGGWRWDEETGDLVFWGRLPAADGATFLAGITRAEIERTRTTRDDEAPAPADEPRDADDSEPDTCDDGPDASHRPADLTGPAPSDPGAALVAMAQMCLAATEAPAGAPAAEVVFVHGRADLVAGGSPTGGGSAEPPRDERQGGSAEPSPPAPSREHGPPPRLPRTTRVPGGPGVAADVAHEVMCAAVLRHVRAAPGVVLAYGRRRRKVSPHQLKALLLRDGGCRMPGCGRTRFLHAHHVVYWSRGGATDLDNLILLCGSCHRAVHRGSIRIRALGGQRFRFTDLRGRPVPEAPEASGSADAIVDGPAVEPDDISGRWAGEPLDLPLATSGYLESWIAQYRRATQPEVAPVG